MATNFWLNRSGISLGNLASDPSNGANGDFYYNTTIKQFRGFSNGNWGSIGGGSGQGKNYITQYIASTSSGNPNPGNGDFETGGTNGWVLAHSALSSFIPTSLASPGTPFDSTHGGSAPSGNLSFATVSSSQLAGRFSGNLASSAASVAGDMLISNAFFIDVEDQSSAMSFSFSYQAVSGTFNFSGSNANTFAVYIYDVTNALWIQPAGVYNLVQSLGVGKAFGSFQSSSNGTAYQIALININATSGAYSLYVDDFSVGPQNIAFGAPISDWQPYNLVIGGAGGSAPTIGTASINSAQWRRIGGSMEIMYSLVTSTAGSTGSASVYLFPLPPGYSADTSIIPISGNITQPTVGTGSANTNAGIGGEGICSMFDSQNMSIIVDENGTTQNQQVSSTFFNTGGSSGITYSLHAMVPIAGWGSSVSMSNDTDTRVVAFFATDTSSSSTGGTTQFANVYVNTHNSFASGVYTAPVSGIYEIETQLWVGSNVAPSISVNKNGGGLVSTILNRVANDTISGGRTGAIVSLIAGDQITVTMSGGYTLNNAGTNYLQISRISGPATIAASEAVLVKATNTAGTFPMATPIIASSVVYDTHESYNSSTGQFTCPIAGYYHVTIASVGSGSGLTLNVYQNGVIQTFDAAFVDSGGSVNATFTIKCNAGDLLDVRPTTSYSLTTVALYFELIN